MRRWNLQNERWTRPRRGGFTCRPHRLWREAELGLRPKRKQRKRALAWRVARGDDHSRPSQTMGGCQRRWGSPPAWGFPSLCLPNKCQVPYSFTWGALGQIRLSFVLIVVPGFVLELT